MTAPKSVDMYVTLARVTRSGQMIPAVGVQLDRPEVIPGHTLAIYRADRCPSRDAAVGMVMEWLARGRPREMTVGLVHEASLRRSEVPS